MRGSKACLRTSAAHAPPQPSGAIAADSKASDGKASVTPLKMNKEKGYGEVKFFWTRKSGGVSELLVRGCVNARRQMAVCTFLHTKDDGINARFGQ